MAAAGRFSSENGSAATNRVKQAQNGFFGGTEETAAQTDFLCTTHTLQRFGKEAMTRTRRGGAVDGENNSYTVQCNATALV
jgi:hypothetical protein